MVIRFYFLQTIFPHIRRHYWGTYRSGAQVFVYPAHRMRPPITQMTTDNVRVLEVWWKRRDRSEIVKRLLSRTLSLTLRTKSSFTKDVRPLHASSCTFSRPSLNIRTYFLTVPSLIALSPYTWQIWWWISLGSTFLTFKKRITDRISRSAAPSVVLNMFNAQQQT